MKTLNKQQFNGRKRFIFKNTEEPQYYTCVGEDGLAADDLGEEIIPIPETYPLLTVVNKKSEIGLAEIIAKAIDPNHLNGCKIEIQSSGKNTVHIVEEDMASAAITLNTINSDEESGVSDLKKLNLSFTEFKALIEESLGAISEEEVIVTRQLISPSQEEIKKINGDVIGESRESIESLLGLGSQEVENTLVAALGFSAKTAEVLEN